jgi:thiamine pyrophosphokinase
MLAIVVLAGDLDPPLRLGEWRRQAGLVVAADGGAQRALALGLSPDVIVGDMDSLDGETLAQLQAAGAQVEVYPRAKDATDGELAVRAALDRGAAALVICCALGGRLDQTLGNLFMLATPQLAGAAVLASGGVEVKLVSGEAAFEGTAGDTLSLLPLGEDALGVTTEGLEYPLRDEPLRAGLARGMSNVFTGARARVVVATGKVLAVHTRQTDASMGGEE